MVGYCMRNRSAGAKCSTKTAHVPYFSQLEVSRCCTSVWAHPCQMNQAGGEMCRCTCILPVAAEWASVTQTKQLSLKHNFTTWHKALFIKKCHLTHSLLHMYWGAITHSDKSQFGQQGIARCKFATRRPQWRWEWLNCLRFFHRNVQPPLCWWVVSNPAAKADEISSLFPNAESLLILDWVSG